MTRAITAAVLMLGMAGTAAAQVRTDFSGLWSAGQGNFEELPLRGDPGVEAGEYVGIPINDAGRQHADAWQPGMHSLLEWQARPHPVTYSMRAARPTLDYDGIYANPRGPWTADAFLEAMYTDLSRNRKR